MRVIVCIKLSYYGNNVKGVAEESGGMVRMHGED